MKICNKLISLVFVAVIMLSLALPVLAYEGGVSPYYNNTSTATADFSISSSGVATVNINCRGIRGTTTKIVVTTVIQKQSGSSWINVSNASWTDESTVYYCIKEHTVQLNSRGTYKAIVTFTVSGSGGANDVITSTIEKTY